MRCLLLTQSDLLAAFRQGLGDLSLQDLLKFPQRSKRAPLRKGCRTKSQTEISVKRCYEQYDSSKMPLP